MTPTPFGPFLDVGIPTEGEPRHVAAVLLRELEQTRLPNRYGLPAFYALHAWIWKSNPAGALEAWNPRVSCDGG